MFCTFIFAVFQQNSVFLQLISYGDIQLQKFYNHDLDHLGSRDIQMSRTVSCGGIRLASFSSPFSKTSHQMQRSWRYLLQNPNYRPFISNFVAMATRKGRGRISLAAFDGPTLKIPLWTLRSRRYLQQKPSYSPFCPQFRCHGNQGQSRVNLNDTSRLAIPKIIPQNQKLRLCLIHSQSYDRLKNCLIFPIDAIVIFLNFSNK